MAGKPPPDKLPPHDEAAEAATLGCVLNDSGTLPQVLALGESAFYDERHKAIFRAFAAMSRDNVPIDLVTVQQGLNAKGILDQFGGLTYLSKIQNDVPSVPNLPAWLSVVREKSERRSIIKKCREVAVRAEDESVRIDDLKFAVQTDLADVFGGSSGGLPDLIDAADFLARPIDPPAELVAGILHRGSKLVLGGSSKSFKTWSLLDLAISVSAGADWLGRPTAQGRVLFVNFEIQPHAWQRRIEAVATAKGGDIQQGSIHLWNLRGHAADFRQLIPRIIQRCRAENFALIVLDPIYKLYSGTDENAAGDVAELLNSLERLATETGGAIAFGAHFAKGNASAKEAIDRISGSGVFARDPDSLLIFTKHETEDAFTVEPILRNFPPVRPFAVRWEFPLMVQANELDPARLKQAAGRKKAYDNKKLLSAIANTTPENPISVSAWTKLEAAGNVPRQTLTDYLPEMRRNGWIETTGEGNSARQYITRKGKAFVSDT